MLFLNICQKIERRFYVAAQFTTANPKHGSLQSCSTLIFQLGTQHNHRTICPDAHGTRRDISSCNSLHGRIPSPEEEEADATATGTRYFVFHSALHLRRLVQSKTLIHAHSSPRVLTSTNPLNPLRRHILPRTRTRTRTCA
jgi:hypothetical protein